MSDLIKALQIFLKYGDPKYPTTCEHEILYVFIDPEIVSAEDIDALEQLGFLCCRNGVKDCFYSRKYGSADFGEHKS